MQQELTNLQPQLIKTSAETEKLMKKIAVDTTEVEAKKEVRIFGGFYPVPGGLSLRPVKDRGSGVLIRV